MNRLRAAFLLLLASATFVALDRAWPAAGARIPPAGRLAGIWVVPAASRTGPPSRATVAGLRDAVQVVWDDREIPHVFANNEHDLYVAQGWLVARHRLWQMDFQTLAAEGRLAEAVGASALTRDRRQRRLGMTVAMEHAVEATREDPEAWAALQAFAVGVNAWIDDLDPRNRPLEYKILHDRPRRWSAERSVIALRSMSEVLSLSRDDLSQSIARERLGRETVESLFPTRAPFADPIIPRDTVWSFDPVPIPEPATSFPDPSALVEGPDPESPDEAALEHDLAEERWAAMASNNWAVAGRRTATGRPILAGDPHLPLSLPSVWYEVQLHAPGIDVYGVTLPGVPGVIIGFNREFAWSMTNGHSDVVDWRTIEFRDETMREYRHDGGWRDVTWREETIRVRNDDAVVERVPWTHHGPVPAPPGVPPAESWIPRNCALRWTGHDRSSEVSAILQLDRARDLSDIDAVARRFGVPGQNVAFASRSGRIGIVHAGRLPVRWDEQGRYVGDGADPAFDWHGFIPPDHLPAVIDPERGFVGSANQSPTDASYPYWLGWSYGAWERGARIHELLSVAENVRPEDMLAMQTDVVSEFARTLLPAMLAHLGPDGERPETETRILDDLRSWDGGYRANSPLPTVFDRWQRALADAIWGDEFATNDGRPAPRPHRDVTAATVIGGASPWFDDRRTAETETLDDLVRPSFERAVEDLMTRHGPYGETWNWGQVRSTAIRHLAQFPGFGVEGLAVDGQYGVLRAVTGSSGPSWRMVVELGDPMRAWGEYPGGQNGDPASTRYTDGIDAWVDGRVRELLVFDGPDADDPRVTARTVLEPAP